MHRLNRFAGARQYRITVPDEWPACNPSIAADGENFLVTVRTLNYRLQDNGHWGGTPEGGVLNAVWLVSLDADLAVTGARKIEDRHITAAHERARNGFEDARLFHWQDEWWIAAAAHCHGSATRRTTFCVCRLDGARIAEVYFARSPFNSASEKNWMPAARGAALEFVYRVAPLQIMHFGRDGVFSFEARPQADGALGCQLEGWSGSSQLVRYRDRWLCVVHHRVEERKRLRYEHAFVELDEAFRITRVSDRWCFDGPTVEFCAGLCLAGENAILGYGHLDREARLTRLPLWIVEALLENSAAAQWALWRACAKAAARRLARRVLRGSGRLGGGAAPHETAGAR